MKPDIGAKTHALLCGAHTFYLKARMRVYLHFIM